MSALCPRHAISVIITVIQLEAREGEASSFVLPLDGFICLRAVSSHMSGGSVKTRHGGTIRSESPDLATASALPACFPGHPASDASPYTTVSSGNAHDISFQERHQLPARMTDMVFGGPSFQTEPTRIGVRGLRA